MLASQELLWLLRKQVKKDDAVVKHEDPFHVLVSTVLSQRTRDENTVKASKSLFAEFSTPKQIAEAPISEIERLIRKSGFYRVKARYVKRIAEIIVEEYSGRTPDKVSDLVSLPGVGRKTANCVLVYGFRKPAIPVDVHVHRISNRLGIVNTKTPERTELELEKFLPRKFWIEINHLMVRHGQKTCLPRNPKCGECLLKSKCDYGRSQK
jgi:endonuclease-3